MLGCVSFQASLLELSQLDEMKNHLIETCADDGIDETEQAGFAEIQSGLEQLSLSMEAFHLWTEKMGQKSDDKTS